MRRVLEAVRRGRFDRALTISGTIETEDSGERYLSVENYAITDSSATVAHMFMNNESVRQNVGLYIKTCGDVTLAGKGYFYISDSGSDNLIRVESSVSVYPGNFVSVTGVSSLYEQNGSYIASIKAIDIDVLKQ